MYSLLVELEALTTAVRVKVETISKFIIEVLYDKFKDRVADVFDSMLDIDLAKTPEESEELDKACGIKIQALFDDLVVYLEAEKFEGNELSPNLKKALLMILLDSLNIQYEYELKTAKKKEQLPEEV
jgi:hypothetical protein